MRSRYKTKLRRLLAGNRQTILYGLSLALLLFLLKWLELRFMIITHAFHIYIGSFPE